MSEASMLPAVKWKSYSTEVPGKWVLAGEHTVLRGGTAIALPHPDLKLRLEFRPMESARSPAFTVEPDYGMLVIQELLRIAQDWLAERGVRLEFPRGHLKLTSTIPFGAGLGSSAALSVATARWVLSASGLERALERDLARQMENRFHGKSSGMDVSVVSIGEPILFSMKEGAVSLGLSHLPHFVFADTGLRSSTKDCIERVERTRTADSVRGAKLDREMDRATQEILEALRAYDDAFERGDTKEISVALAAIGTGITRSREVFRQWGLIPEGLDGLIQDLERAGWRDWRLTGSGGGGFLVGLKK